MLGTFRVPQPWVQVLLLPPTYSVASGKSLSRWDAIFSSVRWTYREGVWLRSSLGHLGFLSQRCCPSILAEADLGTETRDPRTTHTQAGGPPLSPFPLQSLIHSFTYCLDKCLLRIYYVSGPALVRHDPSLLEFMVQVPSSRY